MADSNNSNPISGFIDWVLGDNKPAAQGTPTVNASGASSTNTPPVPTANSTQAEKDAYSISLGQTPGYEAGLPYVGGRGSMGTGVLTDAKGNIYSVDPKTGQSTFIKQGTPPAQQQLNYNSNMPSQNLDQLWKQQHPNQGDRPAGWHGDSAQTAPPISANDVRNAATSGLAGKYLDGVNIDDLISKYANSSRDNVGKLAADIEARATDAAKRAYDTTMSYLSGKKSEVGTLAGTQRQNLTDQQALTSQELSDKSDTEQKSIAKQKTQYEEQTAGQQDQLVRNWKDLSLEVQAIARSRGATDSSFASEKESGLLMNLNKGLTAIAQQSTEAAQNFADAVDETVKFYTRQKAQLDLDTNNQMGAIDSWERQQIAAIQNQEGVALNNKLDQIDAARTQADNLRTQVEQSITQQTLGLGTWLAQQKIAYQTAVATAAQGKVGAAVDNIAKINEMFKLTTTVLNNGGQFIQEQGADGNPQTYVYGKIPFSNEEVKIPVSDSYVNQQSLGAATQYKNLNNTNPLYQAAGNNATTGDYLDLGAQTYGLNTNSNPVQKLYQTGQ